MSEKKTLEFGFICGGRRSKNTYNSLVTMYQYAKENGYIDINVNFIEPELEKYKEVIEQIKEYIKNSSDMLVVNNYSFPDKPVIDKKAKKDLFQILNKVGDIDEKKN